MAKAKSFLNNTVRLLLRHNNPLSRLLLANTLNYKSLLNKSIEVPVCEARESQSPETYFAFNRVYNCQIVTFHAKSNGNIITAAAYVNNNQDSNLKPIAEKFSKIPGAFATLAWNQSCTSTDFPTGALSAKTRDFVSTVLTKEYVPIKKQNATNTNFIINQDGKLFERPLLYTFLKDYAGEDLQKPSSSPSERKWADNIKKPETINQNHLR